MNFLKKNFKLNKNKLCKIYKFFSNNKNCKYNYLCECEKYIKNDCCVELSFKYDIKNIIIEKVKEDYPKNLILLEQCKISENPLQILIDEKMKKYYKNSYRTNLLAYSIFGTITLITSNIYFMIAPIYFHFIFFLMDKMIYRKISNEILNLTETCKNNYYEIIDNQILESLKTEKSIPKIFNSIRSDLKKN